MARRSVKGPIQITVDDTQFNREISGWENLSAGRVLAVLDETQGLIFNSVVNKTPALTGRARASWTKVSFGLFSRGVVSFLVYIRRLELGRAKRRRRAGQKLPVGGYRMVRLTEKEVPKMIRYAALRVLGGAR